MNGINWINKRFILPALVVSFIFSGGVVNVNGRKLCPRIILMTDGKPTDENGRDTEQVRL